MLASEEDVSSVLALYQEHFSTEATDEMPLEVNQIRLDIPFVEPIQGADPGIEIEFLMSSKELSAGLGFKEGLPFVFNKQRHADGYTPWDSSFEDEVQGIKMQSIKLQWHQLAGVHAIIRLIFTEESSPSHCTGVLLADDVGLGKTFQACTVIGFLGELAVRQAVNKCLPPIIGEFIINFSIY